MALRTDISHILVISTIAEWLSTLGLIFGGCCSNALALELITSQHTHAGSLITFAQFLFITVFGLRKQLMIIPSPISREEALKRISLQIFRLRKASITTAPLKVVVEGADEEVAATVTQELVSCLRGQMGVNFESSTLSWIENLEPKTSTNGSHPQNPDLPKIIFYPQSHPVVSLPHEPDFTVLLHQLGTTPVPKLPLPYTAVDFTQEAHPVILHPTKHSILFNPLHIRLKRRRIPISRYLTQVILFLLVNLLNNAAFAYNIPMAVHIIFRSGGLVVNMIMGWLIEGRRYSKIQVFSVVLVTLGVALTTMSSMQSKLHRSSKPQYTAKTANGSAVSSNPYFTYATGILILTLALVFSGFLGLSQDRTFAQYGRGHWEEAMFYLHALALPMFSFVGPDLAAQLRAVQAGPQVALGLHTVFQPLQALSTRASAAFGGEFRPIHLSPLPFLPVRSPTLLVPAFYLPLLLNVLTQVVCVSGVNRLTSRVNSLTVSLVLVVRKAASLAISVLLLGGTKGSTLLWAGATAVLVGSIGYTIGGNSQTSKDAKKKE